MKALVFSPAAEADINGIWDYSADNWGPDQADRYTDEIRDACRTLVAGRKHGRSVDVRPGYLKLSTGFPQPRQPIGDHARIERQAGRGKVPIITLGRVIVLPSGKRTAAQRERLSRAGQAA